MVDTRSPSHAGRTVGSDRDSTMTKEVYKQESWLKDRYVSQRLTTYEMAEEANVSDVTIGNWLERYGIERRDRSESQIQHRKTAPKIVWKNGYWKFQVYNNGEPKSVYVHQLCAIAWDIASPHEVFGGGMDIHHETGVRWDNREENLVKMSHSNHRQRHAIEQPRNMVGDFV